ncbi:MAG: hypothetical protein JXQ84_06810 [Rhodospirillaceae bacterium]|nr:hypothetical protein [Rhodospirillaceae bacterium]
MTESGDTERDGKDGPYNCVPAACFPADFPEAFLVATQGKISFANGAFYRFSGLEPGDVQGNSQGDVLRLVAVSQKAIDHLTSSDDVAGPIESEATGHDGVRRIFRIYRFRSRGCAHQDSVDTMMFIDDTPWREAQRATEVLVEQLLRADRQAALGEMAMALAHEINQPLGAIVNFAGAARHTLRGRAIRANELEDVLQNISAEAARAGDVIKSLRSFLRGKPPTASSADVNAAVRAVLGFAEPAMREQSIMAELQLAAYLPQVQADQTILQQIVLNLVTNAIQAVQDLPLHQRRLFIATFVEGENTVAIAVRDAGTGVPQDLGERIFDPFVTTKENGSGLGLSIARTLAQRLGGAIEVLPEEGWGASFTIRLPCRCVEGQGYA